MRFVNGFYGSLTEVVSLPLLASLSDFSLDNVPIMSL
jgi:hypothetical protein